MLDMGENRFLLRNPHFLDYAKNEIFKNETGWYLILFIVDQIL